MNIAQHSADSERDVGNAGVMAWMSRYPSLSSPTATWLGSLLMVERIGVFPASGDIRHATRDAHALLAHLKQLYGQQALDIDERDGLKVIFSDWRFRVRLAVGEPVIVINVESRCVQPLLPLKTAELMDHLQRFEQGLG